MNLSGNAYYSAQVASLQEQVASLLLYSEVLEDDLGKAFLSLLHSLSSDSSQKLGALQAYSRWFHLLASYNQTWQSYLVTRILESDNPFSIQAQHQPLENLPPALVAAAKHDLQVLQNLYDCSSKQVSEWLQKLFNLSTPLLVWEISNSDNHFLHSCQDWTEALEDLALYYQKQGTGLFAKYDALSWRQGELKGIVNPDPVRLNEIVGYEAQKQALVQNTEFLLAGYSALHVLLYGSRGSGKSSLVKGLLSEYRDRGLKLIEVTKSELTALPNIVEQVRNLPHKFIIFVDDLSFEEDNDAFKALKVVLEGSVTAKAQNVVVYATSNRRHLIREFFGDKPSPANEEVHAWDTIQEKLSFSDRFGLTLTFEPANQNTYLKIVHALAKQAKIALNPDELEFRAKQWATRHNGRSGRTARQFIDYLQGELALNAVSS